MRWRYIPEISSPSEARITAGGSRSAMRQMADLTLHSEKAALLRLKQEKPMRQMPLALILTIFISAAAPIQARAAALRSERSRPALLIPNLEDAVLLNLLSPLLISFFRI